MITDLGGKIEPPRHMISDRTKIRAGVVTNRAVYLAIGIDCDGQKQVLGMWVGPTIGESAKFWLSVLSEVRSRGVADVCIVCCDGLTGLPDAIGVVWPAAVVQLCVVHLIRASLRYASRKYWAPLARDLRLVYTAADEQAAAAALEDFAANWQDRYPAIVKLWRVHWAEFTPFLAFPSEVRRVIYTTNLIESVNARLRKVNVISTEGDSAADGHNGADCKRNRRGDSRSDSAPPITARSGRRPQHDLVKQRGKLIGLYFGSRELHSLTPITSLRVGLHPPRADSPPPSPKLL